MIFEGVQMLKSYPQPILDSTIPDSDTKTDYEPAIAPVDYHGVAMLVLGTEEALDDSWRARSELAEVVRIERPPVECWPELRARGFLPKPQWIMWLADVGEDEETFISRLSSSERRKIRLARRKLGDEGLRLDVRPVDAALFDEFLVLYEDSLTRMRHGMSVAGEEREAILADSDRYVAICVTDGNSLVGCCLAQRLPDDDLVRVRFSAADLPHRESGLARVLYLEAARVTRSFGHRTFSLGKDPNLYGHIAETGLLRFKLGLGFEPRPSHHVDPAIGYDQADLVVSNGALADPAMLLGYVDDVPDGRLRLEVFSGTDGIDLRPFATKFAHGLRVHRLPAQAADSLCGAVSASAAGR
jgi:hypothetical protein